MNAGLSWHYARRIGRRGPRREGFTLIEVLAALTVLSVIVMLLGRLFSDSQTAYTTGTRRADLDNVARTTFDFLSMEISQAVVDNLLYLVVENNATTHPLGRQNDLIRLVSLSNKAERRGSNTYRDSQAVMYFVSNQTGENQGLWRRVNENFDPGTTLGNAYKGQTNALNGLNISTSTLDSNIIAPEVIHMKAAVTPLSNPLLQISGFDSRQHGMPLWLDLYLELLSLQDMERATLLTGAAREDFIREKGRRYSTRILLNNRQQPVTY